MAAIATQVADGIRNALPPATAADAPPSWLREMLMAQQAAQAHSERVMTQFMALATAALVSGAGSGMTPAMQSSMSSLLSNLMTPATAAPMPVAPPAPPPSPPPSAGEGSSSDSDESNENAAAFFGGAGVAGGAASADTAGGAAGAGASPAGVAELASMYAAGPVCRYCNMTGPHLLTKCFAANCPLHFHHECAGGTGWASMSRCSAACINAEANTWL